MDVGAFSSVGTSMYVTGLESSATARGPRLLRLIPRCSRYYRYTLFIVLLGVFLFDDLTQYNQYLGPIFFWSFVMLVYFAVLAAFIAFILDAFTKAKRKAEAEYDYLKNMLSARLRDQWSFARNRVSKSMARTRTQRMPGSMRRLTLRVRDAYRKDSKPHQSARLEAAMSHYLPHLARRADFAHQPHNQLIIGYPRPQPGEPDVAQRVIDFYGAAPSSTAQRRGGVAAEDQTQT